MNKSQILKQMNIFLFSVAFALMISFLIIKFFSMFSYRHDIINGKMYKALHIEFPGYSTHYKPKNEIDLSKWVGSKYLGITAEVNGVKNPEIEASIALKSIGVADSTYVLEQRGEHYFLVSPEKSWEVWDWSHFYRIGKWIYEYDLKKENN